MIPTLAKLNCLSTKGIIRSYQTEAEGLDLYRYDKKAIIDQVFCIYDKFSQVSGLKSNDAKTIYGTKFDEDYQRMITLTDYLINEHENDRAKLDLKMMK